MPEHQDLQVLGGLIGMRLGQQASERADDQREHEQHRRMVRSPCPRRESGFPSPTVWIVDPAGNTMGIAQMKH
jgi:hypothetical protein